MSVLVYLFGPPAVGKSTLMAELTGHCRRAVVTGPPLPRTLLIPPDYDDPLPAAVELGYERNGFPGVDSLPYDALPAACAYVARAALPPLILAEGDRLAVLRFFQAARDGGHRVHAVHVTAPPDVIEARYAARGAQQNTAWRAGRVTKAANLATAAAADGFTVTTLNADTLTPAMAATLRLAEPDLAMLGRYPHGSGPW